MSYEKDVELIEGYTKWLAQRRIEVKDDSPSQYMKEKTRDEAFDRLIRARKYIGSAESWTELTGPALVEDMKQIIGLLEGDNDD